MSNNGSQHLSALTKDEITAPHVNLVPLDLPGDLYKHVGDHVWEHLQRLVDAYTVEQRSTCESFIDDIMEMKRVIAETEPKSEARTTLVEAFRQFKEDFAEINTLASPVFWLRIKDPKHQRKVVKRNVMTLPLIWAEVKGGEFREHPFAVDNPEPSLSGNTLEGATTIMYWASAWEAPPLAMRV